MMKSFAYGAALAVTFTLATAAYAQQSEGTSSGSTNSVGTTSGPAAGTPSTLGSGGNVPASPHQMKDTRSSGGKSITQEQGQSGGSGQPMPGKPDTESGPAPTTNGANSPSGGAQR